MLVYLSFSSKEPEKQLNKEASSWGRERVLASETSGLLPGGCVTYRLSESGFPLLYKGATNAPFPALHVTIPDSSLKRTKRLGFILIYFIIQM